MITYKYEIKAACNLDGPYETIKGTLHTRHEMPYRELKDAAILDCPDRYITFRGFRTELVKA